MTESKTTSHGQECAVYFRNPMPCDCYFSEHQINSFYPKGGAIYKAENGEEYKVELCAFLDGRYCFIRHSTISIPSLRSFRLLVKAQLLCVSALCIEPNPRAELRKSSRSSVSFSVVLDSLGITHLC